MTFCKLIQHDLRCGILRGKYLLTAFVTSIPLIQYFRQLHLYGISGTLGDCLLYLFRGEQVISFLSYGNHKIEVPVLWTLLIASCPALHIDYFLGDMSSNGQQIITRCQSRKRWMLSKCLWAMAGGFLYDLIIIVCAVAGCILMKQEIVFSMTPSVADVLLEMGIVPSGQVVFTAILKPLIALISINLLQIMLQLCINPIAAFLICFAALLFSLYSPLQWLPCTGAIALRNICLPIAEAKSWIPIIGGLATQIICVILSLWRFFGMDLLRREDN